MNPLYDYKGLMTAITFTSKECRVSDISSKIKRITPSRSIGTKTEPPDFIASIIDEHMKLSLSISSAMSSFLHRVWTFSSSPTTSSLEDLK
jgi:hypothetical protein